MAFQYPTTNGMGADMTLGLGTINPAALNSSGLPNPSPGMAQDNTPRGTKRSRSPENLGDFPTGGDGADDGDGKPRIKKRSTAPMRRSGGVPESPSQPPGQHQTQILPPQTPRNQTGGLPPQAATATPSQSSPPKTTPKSVVKALPTVRDHTTDQLGQDGDEYIPREYDEQGEKKVSGNGSLNDGRQYRCRTFLVPHRGEKLFMLATECARVLGYRDSYLLFNKNRSLYKIIATQAEKEDLINQEILPFSYRSRQIAIVTAKSMFRQFGSRVVVNGRRVRDDYWEGKARKQGFTEDDLAGEKRPGGAKARDAAAAEANASSSNILGHHGDIVYSNAPVHFGGHPVPQTVQPGMMGQTGGATPLPMITLAPEQNEIRLGDYRNIPRPRQEISGPAYQDRTQSSAANELLTQAHHAVEYNKSVTQQRAHRGNIIEGIWRQPHEPPPVVESQSIGSSQHGLPSITQPSHAGPSSIQPSLQNSQQQIRGQSYSQASHQQNTMAQTPMRGMSSNPLPDQMHGRSPSMSLQSAGMGQNPNTYSGFSPTPNAMWPPPQPQQSPQHSYSSYSTHGGQQQPHISQGPHGTPTPLRQSSSSSQLQPAMQYGMPGMGQGYPAPGRGLYPSEPSPQQYMPQNQPGSQPGGPGWSAQPPPGQNWGWNG